MSAPGDGTPGHLASRAGAEPRWSVTLSSFPAGAESRPYARLSAHVGRKEFIDVDPFDWPIQVDAVLPADTVAP